jgi:HlyD family secretion protein
MTRHGRDAALKRPGRTWVVILAVIAAFAAGAGLALYFSGAFSRAADRRTDSANGKDIDLTRVTALGKIQPAGGSVPVYGPPGDRIDEMHQKDGKPITPGTILKAGDPIATLASREQRSGEVKVAEVELDEARATLKASLEAGRKRIEAAQAELAQLLAGEKNDLAALQAKIGFVEKQHAAAMKQVERLETLRKEGVRVADEDLEKARLAVAQANAELTAARAAYDKAAISYRENRKAAEAKVEAAKAELAEAEAKAPIKSAEERLKVARKALERTTLKAPIDGTVLQVNGREGQPTGMEPVLIMGSLTGMTVVAEVYESDVERLRDWVRRAPVSAEATDPALPKPLTGVVRTEHDVSRMIARNQVFPGRPREDIHRRVVELVIHLDEESSKLAARYVGLQVTVTLTPGK